MREVAWLKLQETSYDKNFSYSAFFSCLTVPPNISLVNPSGKLSVRKGSNVRLACNATGYPTPTILWQREVRCKVFTTGFGIYVATWRLWTINLSMTGMFFWVRFCFDFARGASLFFPITAYQTHAYPHTHNVEYSWYTHLPANKVV